MPSPKSTGSAKSEQGQPTALMQQYLEIKSQHQDCLLFYRLGDFYELFFDDAIQAANNLGLTLTKRGYHQGQEVPMCGVPAHAHQSYLHRLLRHGFRVAICEQTEPESKGRGKSLLPREVVRVETAGTVTQDALLDLQSNNYLAAIACLKSGVALAWLDLSSADLLTQPFSQTVGTKSEILQPDALMTVLARLQSRELLLSQKTREALQGVDTLAGQIVTRTDGCFDPDSGRQHLERIYGLGTLDSFGAFTAPELAAAGVLMQYVELTQKSQPIHLRPPRRVLPGTIMEIDASTRSSLELTGKGSSLLSAVDCTVTAAGARLLCRRLSAPLTDICRIQRRLQRISKWLETDQGRQILRHQLKATPDLERALSRLALGRGGPRDLAAIRDGLAATIALRDQFHGQPIEAELTACFQALHEASELFELLQKALVTYPPMQLRDGNFIARGYLLRLDELTDLRNEGARQIKTLEQRYIRHSRVASLKIRHNNILGYHIEVTSAQASKLANQSELFIQRQTTANSVRFTTIELGELERAIADAEHQSFVLEQSLFEELVGSTVECRKTILELAGSLAKVDVESSLAELAAKRGWTKPAVDDSCTLTIEQGRHPTLERLSHNSFVANDCDMQSEQRLWLITGPNMAGKSTFLRQNALIIILAQMGSYVPAARASIGIVDRLFSRIGASDELARGYSTFMVEMIETATILNQATPRSFVILDELGRGTSASDGLAIAWACSEHLHSVNRCRVLFATHLRELCQLNGYLKALACYAMKITEWQGEVIFQRKVIPGISDRSYGLHVAAEAGIPAEVVSRAKYILSCLERYGQKPRSAGAIPALPLFSGLENIHPAVQHASPRKNSARQTKHSTENYLSTQPLLKELQELNPDNLTPRAALDLIYRWKNLVSSS